MKINIDTILENKGKSRYWLAKEIGIAYTTMKKLADNKTESVRFETIENMCIALECTPNDLLIIEKNILKKDL